MLPVSETDDVDAGVFEKEAEPVGVAASAAPSERDVEGGVVVVGVSLGVLRKRREGGPAARVVARGAGVGGARRARACVRGMSSTRGMAAAPATQNFPAPQGKDVAVTLAAAVQKPAAHATQEEGAVKDAPPADHVPAGHAFTRPIACLATQ